MLLVGKGKAVADYNLPRECIRSFFPTRKCIVFPSPVKDDEQLKHLESLSDGQLVEQFRDKRDKFLDYVLGRSEPKKVDVSTVNGRCNCLSITHFSFIAMMNHIFQLSYPITR